LTKYGLLTRGVREQRYLTLKVHTCVAEHAISQHDTEVAISRHLQSIETEHPGKGLLRFFVDEFAVSGPHGTHPCLLFPPLGMTLTQFKNRFPGRVLPKDLVQQILQLVLLSVDFLHQAEVIHKSSDRLLEHPRIWNTNPHI